MPDVDIALFDTADALPQDGGDHLTVVTARDAHNGGVVTTQVHVSYRVDGKCVSFRRNSNMTEVRFEDALKWAVAYAKQAGIGSVYAVFELDRPIDPLLLARFFPDGRGDRRSKRAPKRGAPACAPHDAAQRHERPLDPPRRRYRKGARTTAPPHATTV